TVSVSMTDSLGNEGTAVAATSSYDGTAPTGYSVAIDTVAHGNQTISFTLSGGESTNITYSYTISSDNGGSILLNDQAYTDPTTITDLDISSLSEGVLTVSVSMTDSLGNEGTAVTATSSYDGTAPSGYSVAIDTVAHGNQMISFTLSGGESTNTTYGYTITSDNGGSVSLNDQAYTDPTIITDLDISSLSEGVLTVSISMTDSLGNEGAAVTATSTYDGTAPTGYSVAIDTVAHGNETISFTLSGGESTNSTYSYTITSDNGGSVSLNDQAYTDPTIITDLDISSLSEGVLTVSVSMTDSLGNEGAAVTAASGFDTTSPTTGIDTLSTEDTTPMITGTVDDATASLVVKIDNQTLNATNSSGVWSVLTEPLGTGTYDVTVEASDSAGNATTTLFENAVTIESGIDYLALDSLALVKLFQATEGTNWNDQTGWLSADLSDWFGLTIANGRVTAIDLSSNGLKGTIPAFTTGLDAVTNMNLSANELHTIESVATLTSLETLNISGNALDFSDLLALINGTYTLTYSDQDLVLDATTVLTEIGTTYTVDRTVVGADTYKWYYNGEVISQSSSAFDIAIDGFENEGTYFADVTNDQLPNMTLSTNPIQIKVSSIERDSISLIGIYESIAGESTTISDWTAASIIEWPEVTIANDRVVGLNLSDLGLSGEIGEELLDVTELEEINLSNNQIKLVPSLASLDSLKSANLTHNHLDFATIEANYGLEAVDYGNQVPLGIAFDAVKVSRSANHMVTLETRGTNLSYQWKLNGDTISGATGSTHEILDIGIDNMGDYTVEVTSELAGGVVLESAPQTVLAVADIRFTPAFNFADGTPGILSEGEGLLFRVTDSGPYDTVSIVDIQAQSILFNDVVLGDYLMLARTEANESQGSDFVEFIPTYYTGVIDWDSATVLELREGIDDTLNMVRIPPPLSPFDQGIVNLTVSSELVDAANGRIESRRRVKKAGCSLRRRTTGGGGRLEEDIWELVVYKETDENGEVNFGNLPEGFYRINVQYPGVPMDPTSFVEFEIGEEEANVEYDLEANITEEGIVVELIEALGFKKAIELSIEVYPNPVSDLLNIRTDAGNAEFVLFDLEGRQLLRENRQFHSVETFDVSRFDKGIYLIRIIANDAFVSKKLIINR
ncbi:MAG: T9SS type A sorting domain-containing protein, partial [Cyclobacteriaceae bacterium]